MILAIDTASEYASVALLREGQAVRELSVHSEAGHSQWLFAGIEELLAAASTRLDEITCFAAATGPGSFTGVRVALAAVKGLAEAMAKPVVGVSNLAALAWHGAGPLRAPLIDARRGEVYAALYDARLEVAAAETAGTLAAFLERVRGREIEFVASGFETFDGLTGAPRVTAPRGLAPAVAHIAAQRLAAGEAQDPAAVGANYVRRSGAEMNWR